MNHKRVADGFIELGWEAALPRPDDDPTVRLSKKQALERALEVKRALLQQGEAALPRQQIKPVQHPIRRPPQLQQDGFHTPLSLNHMPGPGVRSHARSGPPETLPSTGATAAAAGTTTGPKAAAVSGQKLDVSAGERDRKPFVKNSIAGSDSAAGLKKVLLNTGGGGGGGGGGRKGGSVGIGGESDGGAEGERPPWRTAAHSISGGGGGDGSARGNSSSNNSSGHLLGAKRAVSRNAQQTRLRVADRGTRPRHGSRLHLTSTAAQGPWGAVNQGNGGGGGGGKSVSGVSQQETKKQKQKQKQRPVSVEDPICSTSPRSPKSPPIRLTGAIDPHPPSPRHDPALLLPNLQAQGGLQEGELEQLLPLALGEIKNSEEQLLEEQQKQRMAADHVPLSRRREGNGSGSSSLPPPPLQVQPEEGGEAAAAATPAGLPLHLRETPAEERTQAPWQRRRLTGGGPPPAKSGGGGDGSGNTDSARGNRTAVNAGSTEVPPTPVDLFAVSDIDGEGSAAEEAAAAQRLARIAALGGTALANDASNRLLPGVFSNLSDTEGVESIRGGGMTGRRDSGTEGEEEEGEDLLSPPAAGDGLLRSESLQQLQPTEHAAMEVDGEEEDVEIMCVGDEEGDDGKTPMAVVSMRGREGEEGGGRGGGGEDAEPTSVPPPQSCIFNASETPQGLEDPQVVVMAPPPESDPPPPSVTAGAIEPKPTPAGARLPAVAQPDSAQAQQQQQLLQSVLRPGGALGMSPMLQPSFPGSILRRPRLAQITPAPMPAAQHRLRAPPSAVRTPACPLAAFDGPSSLRLRLPQPALLAVAAPDGRHVALLLGSHADCEPAEILILCVSIGRRKSTSHQRRTQQQQGAAVNSDGDGEDAAAAAAVRVVGSVGVQRSVHADTLPLTASSLALGVTREGDPVLVLSAMFELPEGPASLGRPAVHAVPCRGAPSTWAGRAVGVESNEPFFSVALLGPHTMVAAGDGGAGAAVVEFDPQWRSYKWGRALAPPEPPLPLTAVDEVCRMVPLPCAAHAAAHPAKQTFCAPPEMLAGFSAGGTMALWDISTRRCVAVGADPDFVVCCALPLPVRCPDAPAGSAMFLARLQCRDTGAGAAAVAAASPLGGLSLGPPLQQLGAVSAMTALSASKVVVGTVDGRLRAWDVGSGACGPWLQVGASPAAGVTSLALLSPAGDGGEGGGVVVATSIAGDCLLLEAEKLKTM